MALAELIAIGDTYTNSLNFVEQVSAVTAFSDLVGGESATRTLKREFRTSTDGTYSGSWYGLNNANLNALILDPNNRFYIQVRYTRTGTDATGIIQIHKFSFDYTYDANATFGHGAWTTTGIFSEAHEMIRGILENHVLQNGGYDAYDVMDFHRNFLPDQQKPIIYFYDVDTSQHEFESIGTWSAIVNFRVGIQRRIDATFNYRDQISKLQAIFNPNIAFQYLYELNFKSVLFTGSNMRILGLSEPSVGSVIEFQDDEKSKKYNEFAAQFKVTFQRSLEQLG